MYVHMYMHTDYICIVRNLYIHTRRSVRGWNKLFSYRLRVLLLPVEILPSRGGPPDRTLRAAQLCRT